MGQIHAVKKIHAKRPCPICRSAYNHKLGALEYATFEDNPIANAFDVVACSQCKLVYYDTPSSEEAFEVFYRDHYYVSASGRDNSLVAPANVIKVIEKIVPKNAPICELGCGRGQHLLELKKRGYSNIHGIEPSLECVEYLRSQHGVSVDRGSAASLPADRKFDVIISEHTLEHVLDLDGFVAAVAASLNPSGYVYIELPDLLSYGNHWPRDLITIFEHVNHFTISSLSNLFFRHRMGLKSFGTYVIDNIWRGSLPALYAVFQKDFAQTSPSETFDISQVTSWLDDGLLMNEEKINNLAINNIPVYIWGINYTIQKFLKMSALKDCRILGLIDRDRNRQNKRVGEHIVQAPDIIRSAAKNASVIVSEGVYRKDIERNIREMGCECAVVVI